MRSWAVGCWLLCVCPLWAQKVTVPAEVKTPVGRLASVLIEWDGVELKWTAPDGDLDIFREYDQNPKMVRLRVIAYKPGKYKLSAIASNEKGKLSEFGHCMILAGDPEPPVPPVPPDPPVPPGPNPVNGKVCLIVYETEEAAKLPEKQQQILYGKTIRDYLRTHTDKDSTYPDGAWRIWDKDVDLTNAGKVWTDLMGRKREKVPWLVVGNGKNGWEGPLPATVEETLTLLKKYLGD